MLTIVFLFVCYVSVFIITVLLCLLLLCMLFLICMVLNICNFIQRTEQVPVELDISAIEEYILLLLLYYRARYLSNLYTDSVHLYIYN